jgi:hypothetical protein
MAVTMPISARLNGPTSRATVWKMEMSRSLMGLKVFQRRFSGLSGSACARDLLKTTDKNRLRHEFVQTLSTARIFAPRFLFRGIIPSWL